MLLDGHLDRINFPMTIFQKNLCIGQDRLNTKPKYDSVQGHDVVIIEDMKDSLWRPPVMWIEWYFRFKFANAKIGLLEVTRKHIYRVIQ